MKPRWTIGGGLSALSFALTAAMYRQLPDPMPTHFDWLGHADGFIAKPLGPFVLPVLGLVAYAITALVVARGDRALPVLPIATAAFGLFLVIITLRAALGHAPELPRSAVAGVSLFLAVIGNYFGKLRRNRWIGVRTPWTLGDDEVWLRTHRVAGWLLVSGGAMSCALALAGAPLGIAIAPIGLALVAPAAYSFLVYRRVRARGVQ
jgi:uncharacterized membrane protein